MNERTIFMQALDLGDPKEQEEYLRRVCGDNDPLRARVEDLLRSHRSAGSFVLDRGRAVDLAATVDAPPLTERPGTVVGHYKLLEVIGEGGMGVVYMAEQTQPVRRKVALKVIKPGMDTEQVIARFEAERQALAMMDHPNIAKVLDAGTTASGRPYFAMELVRGIPITDYCDREQLSIPDRLELFVLICRAVQHAHQKGVIHRDIKPSNVMITLHDGVPVPKVIDFGIAKATGQSLTDKTLYTAYAQLIGTPLYMSPEQAEMSGLDVDTRSDIYSLGVLLYELLTGTTPFDPETLRTAALDEMRRIIREEEPPNPSMRLNTPGEALSIVSVNRKADPRYLYRAVRGELDWIVMRSLEKDRRRRYETANDFAADVMRYLTDQPVEAGPPSARYRLTKFARRNRVPLSTVTLVALAMIVGTAVSVWQAARAMKAERQMASALARADARHEMTRQAVDDMYTEVAQHWLKHQSHATPLQKKFLEKALVIYRRFAEEPGSTPEDRRRAADASIRAAQMLGSLGRPRDAEALYERALALTEALVREFPDQQDYRYALASAHNSLAVLRCQIGLPHRAEHDYREALEVMADLAARRPEDPSAKVDWAHACSNLGALLTELGRPLEAEPLQNQALDLRLQLAAQHPENPDFEWYVAKSHVNLAELRKSQGRMGEAEQELRAAEKTLSRLSSLYQDVADLRNDLAGVRLDCGKLLTRMRRLDEGEKQLKEAITLGTDLAKTFPDLPEYRKRLADAEHAQALLLSDLGRDAEADSLFMGAGYVRSKLFNESPDVPAYRKDLAQTYHDRAQFLRKEGRTKEAESFLREGVELWTKVIQETADPAHRKQLAHAFQDLGSLLRDQGHVVEGEEMQRRAQDIAKGSKASRPDEVRESETIRQP